MTEFETNCYGMSESDIREQYMSQLAVRSLDPEGVVMGILSDVQELNGLDGYKELRRKQLNIAKFILSEMIEAREAATEYLIKGKV